MQLSAPHFLHSLSALEKYFRKPDLGFTFRLIEGSVVDIAKAYDNVIYPGVNGIEALVPDDDEEIIYSCVDSLEELPVHPLNVINLLYDSSRGVFIDRCGCYNSLRSLELDLEHETSECGNLTIQHLLEAAALVSRFGFKPSEKLITAFSDLAEKQPPAALIQRLYLSAVIGGEYAAAGLTMLRDFGAVEALWPELHALVGLDQAKEFHPEGDVWAHSLETLYHRKTNDLELSFALLLHDLGKPLSSNADGNRFNNHAQIGRNAAVTFLRRLEFSEEKIEKISFLIENHMMPAAIKSLPTFRTEKAMLNPLFPLLLEVYRCDLLSSFNGPEGYYEACKAYRKFIKNTKNPFRGSDGKKLYRLYVD